MKTDKKQLDTSANGGTTSVSSSDQLPNSKKIYVAGKIHPDLRVPFREISLASTKTMCGGIELNDPVRVYDTSGSWGDSDFAGDVEQGWAPLRSRWSVPRDDFGEIQAWEGEPIDNGWLSEKAA